MTCWLRLALPCAALLGALLATPVRAQEDANADGSSEQALYLDALQALSEGRKGDASDMLARLTAKVPQHAGAWIDLALIQCGLGHSDQAERLFAKVETQFALSRDLLELIAQTREAGCTKWTPVSSTTVVAGRGADQNVNQGTFTSSLIIDNGQPIELPLLSEFRPRQDQFSVLGVDYMREVTPNGSMGFVQYQQRHNDRLHEYDTTSLFAGLDVPYRVGKWALRTTGSAGVAGLGGRLYQHQLQLQAQVTPPLPLPSGTQFSVLGSASRTRYLTLANFDSHNLELRGQLAHRRGSLFVSASLGATDDSAREARPGGNRHGTVASVLARHPLWGDVGAELGYTRQTWLSAKPYSPDLLIDQVRAQCTQVVRGALSYRLDKNQTLLLDARLVRNRENISIFQYNDRLLQLSWQWQLP
jgi:hypothetical protein